MSGELLQSAVAAHGGRELWRDSPEITIRLSSGGFAFASKLQGHAIRDCEVRISTTGQRVVVSPFPREGRRGVLDETGTVRIETDEGQVLESRNNARGAFADRRHKLWWDRLDILYFATYAIWTYLSTPFVLERDDYEVSEIEPWVEGGERYRRLAVTFPEHVHTHSRRQVFYIDDSGLIRRHDYTAEPIGSWANAAHYCLDHQSFDGLLVPTRRMVYPRKADNSRRRRPLLVWIEVPTVAVGS